jgi:hypothetical protein
MNSVYHTELSSYERTHCQFNGGRCIAQKVALCGDRFPAAGSPLLPRAVATASSLASLTQILPLKFQTIEA